MHSVKVDAFRDPNVAGGQTFRIVNRQPNANPNDPDYQHAAAIVSNALGAQGMYEAVPPESADVEVEINYWTGPARLKVETVATPPPSTQQVLSEASIMGPDRNQVPGGLRSPTTGRPVQAIVTTQSEQQVSEVFEKHLTVVARAADPSRTAGTGPEIWRVEATVEDQNNELQSYLPILATAVEDYVGGSSRGQQTVRITTP